MRVAILGLGLIGGSIGLAARARSGARVCGYDPDEGVRSRALQLGAVDEQAPDVEQAVQGADVVFVAAPVGALAGAVTQALRAAGPDCVVTDVGSTKRVVARAAADERFVGGHPLAGAESSGVEHAREDLFEGATWYLTPAREKTAGVLYERLHRLLVSLGARPAAIDAETHDRLMACVSHLPHVLANLLVAQAQGLLAAEGSGRLPAVGPSFRDATRVAGANSCDLDRHLPRQQRRPDRGHRRPLRPPGAGSRDARRRRRCCDNGLERAGPRRPGRAAGRRSRGRPRARAARLGAEPARV